MDTKTETVAERNRIGDSAWELGVDASTSPSPAVRGRTQGSVGWTGASDGRGLANFLGWFSVGLGVVEVVAPRALMRLIGLGPADGSTSVVRAMGLREFASGIGILSNPKSKEWAGSRIGGDALDLALLGFALAKSERRERALLATAVVLGATALDVLGTEQLAESRKAATPEDREHPGTRVRKSITIGRPRNEVYSFWRNITNLPRFMEHLESVEVMDEARSRWRASGPAGSTAEWDAEIVDERENERIAWRSVGASDLHNAGTVHFREAPGGRGTIVTVEMQYAPPGGKIGAAMLKLFRKEPGQQVGDDLRRLKQVLETGEVVLSDATAARGPHPAQPAAPAELH